MEFLKTIKLTTKEAEIVNMLIDEEYEILKANKSEDKHIDIKDLLNVKAKLVLVDNSVKTDVSNAIRLGMEMATLRNSYDYNRMIAFLKGESDTSYYSFDKLKPLYDKYGYELVNNVLLELDKEDQETKEKETGEQQDE